MTPAMHRRNIWTYAAGTAVIIATAWLAYVVVAVIWASRQFGVTGLNSIDVAGNMSGIVVVWIAGVLANGVLLRRVGPRFRRPFRYAFLLATLGPPLAIIASAILFPTIGGAVFLTAYTAGVPLQVVVFAIGLLLLSVKGD